MRTTAWVSAVLLSLPLTIAAGWGVGYAATPAGRPYAWEVATLAATAAGTLSLAIVTGLLSVMTAREVRLTSAIESERHRPVLVEAPHRSVGFSGHDGSGNATGILSVAFRNVGLGPALNVRVTATMPRADVFGASVLSIGIGSVEAIAVEDPDSQPVQIRIPITAKVPGDGYTAEQYYELSQAFNLSLVCIDRTKTEIRDALVVPEPASGSTLHVLIDH